MQTCTHRLLKIDVILFQFDASSIQKAVLQMPSDMFTSLICSHRCFLVFFSSFSSFHSIHRNKEVGRFAFKWLSLNLINNVFNRVSTMRRLVFFSLENGLMSWENQNKQPHLQTFMKCYEHKEELVLWTEIFTKVLVNKLWKKTGNTNDDVVMPMLTMRFGLYYYDQLVLLISLLLLRGQIKDFFCQQKRSVSQFLYCIDAWSTIYFQTKQLSCGQQGKFVWKTWA